MVGLQEQRPGGLGKAGSHEGVGPGPAGAGVGLWS